MNIEFVTLPDSKIESNQTEINSCSIENYNCHYTLTQRRTLRAHSIVYPNTLCIMHARCDAHTQNNFAREIKANGM